MRGLDEEDKDIEEGFKNLLSFYGTELQSHASLVLGLALLLFAGVQAWGQLAATSKLMGYHSVVFSVFIGIIGTGIVFQVLRLYVFGKFASSLIYSHADLFKEGKDEYQKHVPGPNEKKHSWSGGSPFFKASIYSNHCFKQSASPVLRNLVNNKFHVRPQVLFVSFEAWLGLSYALVFGSPDPLSLFVLLTVSTLIGLLGYYLYQKVGVSRENRSAA